MGVDPDDGLEPEEERFLDRAFEKAYATIAAGGDVSSDDLLGDGRERLRSHVAELIRVARDLALGESDALPSVPGYTILGELGRGGMAVVYLARQERLGGRPVALKVLPSAIALSPRARDRFRSEIRAIAQLRHPNIVAVHDVVDSGGVDAFAMEWVEGRTLAEIIDAARRTGPAPDHAAVVCRIGISIARALAAVHEKGLLHRDVKPSNILVRKDGTPLLSDFGLARDTDTPEASRSGVFVGTLAYAAPEQLRGECAIDARADVYALGATLYHALTLRAPFEGNGTGEILRRIESGDAPPIRRVDPRVSFDLQTIVSKAMEPEAARRYASADDLADDLQRLLELQPIHARPSGFVTRSLKRLRRNRSAIVVAAAASALTIAVAAALVVHRFLAPEWVGEHRTAARLALLSPVQGNTIFALSAFDSGRFGSDPQPIMGQANLRESLEAYRAALRFAPFDDALLLERDVVSVARTLIAGDADAARVVETVSESAPLTAALGRGRLGGVPGGERIDAGALRGATPTDLRCLGLLAFLLGDLETALEAWSRFDAEADPDPLVLAALGKLYLVSDRPAQAYPRLQKAAEAFPKAGFLQVDLAEAALRCGDTARAGKTLERARTLGFHDPMGGLRRVEADLLFATGRIDAARAAYLDACRRPGNGVASLHFARFLESQGDAEAAIGQYVAASESGVLCAEIVPAADRYWAALPLETRRRLVRGSLDGMPWPDGIVSLLVAYARQTGSPPREFAAKKPRTNEPPVSPFLERARLGDLCERMEVTDMDRWLRWRTYSSVMKDLLVQAWISERPEAASRSVERLWTAYRRLSAVAASLVAVSATAVAQTSFQGLGDLPGGVFASIPTRISDDGSTVVGGSQADQIEAFRWRASTGMVSLGRLSGPDGLCYGQEVSPDGEIVVGVAYSDDADAPEPREAWMWTEAGGMLVLDDLPGGQRRTEASAITADGSRIFGCGTITSAYEFKAAEWTVGGGVAELTFPGDSHVFHCTPDGTTLVGYANGLQAFRWTAGGGYQVLDDLPGGADYAWVVSVTDDGTEIVGFGHSESGREALLWTETAGTSGLGDLPGGSFLSNANDIAADGSLIVGHGTSAIGREAVIWDADRLLRRADDYLRERCVDIPSGWTLADARSVAINGSVVSITGYGLNPDGDQEAWLATYRLEDPAVLRAGNVDTGAGGPPVDVMFLDGSAGDPVERKVTVTAGAPTTLHIDKAPTTGREVGAYAFWIFDGDLRGCADIKFKKLSGAVFTLGRANQCMPINNTVVPDSCPCPTTFPQGFTSKKLGPRAGTFCLAQPRSALSPVDHAVVFPAGTFTILSVHQDLNSPSSPGKHIAIGNTIVVVSE